uniref:Anaphase-promoting complex subunit 10 n=1 Tax=Megaselia scalaris TaxID=36166 RepID=T1GGW9_MEGSC
METTSDSPTPTTTTPAAEVKAQKSCDPQEKERDGTAREVGAQAVWSLSSCKPGFGVERLRDGQMDTYWHQIYICTDYKLDESYTPSKISIRSGTHFNDLQEIEFMELDEPSGWVVINTKDCRDKPIRTFMIQIAVISNHQNGRDTHMRQIKILSPVEGKKYPLEVYGQFSSSKFQQMLTLR